METQLVRLDEPYNIIFGKEGKFGLHIATLIVVKEKPLKDAETGEVVDTFPETHSYPVVGGGYGMDGEVWMKSEQKDCMVICRKGEAVGLNALKRIMEFGSKLYSYSDRLLILPGSFSVALITYDGKFTLPADDNKKTKTDYVVSLEFSEEREGKSCMVYASKDSCFYFYDYFDNEPPFLHNIHTNLESIKYLAMLRDSYIRSFHYEGLRSITFTTNDVQYKNFVDQLNSTKTDGE